MKNDNIEIGDELLESNPALEEMVRTLTEGTAAKQELAILKPVLAYALSKLPKKQLRVRGEVMDTLADSYHVQAKSDGKGGIILRSVAVL